MNETSGRYRQTIRMPGYDYSRGGSYFVTICTQGKEQALGEVVNGEAVLSAYGQATATAWAWLEHRYRYVELDAWVVMPNHLHGILVIHDDASGMDGAGTEIGVDVGRGGSRWAVHEPPLQADPVIGHRKTLGRLIGAFKTVSTKAINEVRQSPGERFWQRNYYEYIIRNERDLNRIRDYIQSNPARWECHEYYNRSGSCD